MTTVLTVGYEQRDIEDFVALLCEHDVELLIDVRMNAISRKPGFSKTALRTALEDAGIAYLHERAVGNPSEFRKRASSVEECLALYEDHMSDQWDEALPPMVEAVQQKRTCLLCYERDHTTCHRTSVVRELQTRVPEINVQNV